MPVNFNQIARNTAQVKMTGGTLGEDSITIVYYPGRLTDNLLSSVQQMATLESGNVAGLDGLYSLNDALCTLIKSWDVLDADGSMFPLDPRRLRDDLPMPFKAEVLFAIMQDLRPEVATTQLNGAH